MGLATSALLQDAQDVRDKLKESAAKSYRVLISALKDGDLSKSAAPIVNLKGLAAHLDERYGGALASKSDGGVKSVEELALWTHVMMYESISLSFDHALEDLSNEQEVRKTIRYALEEFAEIEGAMKAKDEQGFKCAIEIRKSIQRSMFLLKDRDKFSGNAFVIRKSFSAAFPEAGAYALRNSLAACLKNRKYQQSSEANLKAMEDVLKSRSPEGYKIIERGAKGEGDAITAAMAQLDELFPPPVMDREK